MVNVTASSTSNAKSLPPQPSQIKTEAPPPVVGEIVAVSTPVAKDLAQVVKNSGQEREAEKNSSPEKDIDEAHAMAAWTSTGAKVAEFV